MLSFASDKSCMLEKEKKKRCRLAKCFKNLFGYSLNILLDIIIEFEVVEVFFMDLKFLSLLLVVVGSPLVMLCGL